MEHISRTGIMAVLGAVGGIIASWFGGWDAALSTLVIFMAIDYITGLVVAGVFKRSGKSESGALESRAGWKGICRKGMTLLIVFVAVRLDMAAGTACIKDAGVIAYIVNEALSILENAGLMGLHIPPVLEKAIEVLRTKGEPQPEGKKGEQQ